MDINCKYVPKTSSQCSLITESSTWASSVLNANICTDENTSSHEGDKNTVEFERKEDEEVTEGMCTEDIQEKECNSKNATNEMEQEIHGNIPSNDVVLDEFNNEVYKKFCQDKLCDPDFMHKLVEVLYENSSLDDFMSLVTQLADGTLDAMDMSFLLCLDIAKLEKCKTTRAMQFRKETKQFWEVVYRICHRKGLRLFPGSKNQGSLQSGSTSRGLFDPKQSSHNFAVPDEKSLRNGTDLPSVIL